MRLAYACMVVASKTLFLGSPVAAEPAAQSTTNADATKADATNVATLLFGDPQWGKAPAGSTITYAYSKKTTDAKLGPSFDGKIKLKLGSGDDADSRTAEVRMFSGANARPAGPFRSDKQNPVLLLVFEENVQELSKIFKANPRYLKNAIRKAWRDDAKIENTSIDVDGRTVPGTRITVAPFINDAEKEKMLGLDGMTYTVEIADSTPGSISNIQIQAPANGAPKFSEMLHYESEGKP